MESDNLEFILDHFKNQRNYGTIEDADFSYEEGIPSCGDVIRLDLRIKNNKLDDIKFSGTGCAISQAPKPIPPTILGVPASNFQGSSFQVVFSIVTFSIMSPPYINGSMSWSNSVRP